MIQSGSDQMLSRCRLHMKRKCFFQSQHSAEPNRDPRRSKRSSNIRNKWWEHHLPQQRRCRLADRADADKQTKGKVAIQQPFCAVVALCGLRARIALSCVKENEQLRKQQTGKDNIKGIIFPQGMKFCRISHNSYFLFLKTTESHRQNAPPFPATALSPPW